MVHGLGEKGDVVGGCALVGEVGDCEGAEVAFLAVWWWGGGGGDCGWIGFVEEVVFEGKDGEFVGVAGQDLGEVDGGWDFEG